MDNYHYFMEMTEEEIVWAWMDKIGVKMFPAGPKPPEVW